MIGQIKPRARRGEERGGRCVSNRLKPHQAESSNAAFRRRSVFQVGMPEPLRWSRHHSSSDARDKYRARRIGTLLACVVPKKTPPLGRGTRQGVRSFQRKLDRYDPDPLPKFFRSWTARRIRPAEDSDAAAGELTAGQPSSPAGTVAVPRPQACITPTAAAHPGQDAFADVLRRQQARLAGPLPGGGDLQR